MSRRMQSTRGLWRLRLGTDQALLVEDPSVSVIGERSNYGRVEQGVKGIHGVKSFSFQTHVGLRIFRETTIAVVPRNSA